jgi:hypothetical protein
MLTGQRLSTAPGRGQPPRGMARDCTFGSPESPPASLSILPPTWRPHGIRALISDLLWLEEPREIISAMSDRSAAVYIIQVLAADDVDPQVHGNTRLIDSETDAARELVLDATAIAAYRDRLRRHQEAWRAAAREAGAVFVTLTAEDLCRNWDFGPLVQAGVLAV